MVAISTRNTKVDKICKLCKAIAYIFSAFCNISQPNFANLLILVNALSSRGDLFASPCLVLKLGYNGNCLLNVHWLFKIRVVNMQKYVGAVVDVCGSGGDTNF